MKTLLGFVFFFCVVAIPSRSYAQAPFGGLDLFELPCTCTMGAFEAHYFAPLFLGTAVPVSGFLITPITPLTYMLYYLTPGMWALGFYTPGAGTAACQWYYGYNCAPAPFPSYGLVLPLTGTGPTI